ncbi:magnesium transporter [Luminiphilus sp.]|nr:magnesium transporter [Luminiphilus sp.]MDA8826560.1 magnesium transporter [Luminiphilus sp.]MDA9580046.1 magnesium transporter [Luminiphilus sp.]MDA9847410.1 magnesium transporter [Luminiphilus sp.]MDB4581799.1 magnesium transporter [Draconibacterium sp.]
MNSSVTTEKQLAQLDRALDAGTLGDVAGIVGDLSPGDVAYLITSYPPRIRQVIWSLLEPEQEADVLNELPEDLRNQFLVEMEPKALALIVGQLDDDDVADILHDLPDSITEQVLGIMDETDRTRLATVLAFPDDVAGGLMSTDTISIRADLTLDVVMRYLRRHAEIPQNTDSIMVVNREDHFVGILPIRILLVTDPSQSVREMMLTNRDAIPAQLPAAEVARLFERNDWISAPVVDEQNRLLGRITIDDVVDVIREEADHSLTSLGGIGEDEDTFATVMQTAPRRAVWLGINLITAFIASSVINLFQDTIEKVVALAVLMPIVASMGGVAGTQTLTVLIRGLAMGQLNTRNQRWLVAREALVGMANGILWAIVVAAAASVWFEDWTLGLVIAAAMMINLMTAGLAGAVIPLTLKRLGIDPALAGGVVLTTVTDVVGFLSFLGLAAIFYG